MRSALLALALLPAAALAAPFERRASALPYRDPSSSPTVQTDNYPGRNNGTLKNGPFVPGKAFDRIVQVWFENTNFASAASQESFAKFAKQGQLLDQYYGVTHPSEPNYMAAAFGDFFGLSDDSFNYVPANITSVFDLLDDKGVSYACYQESMATTGLQAYSNQAPDYFSPSSNTLTSYVRKHNPCAFSETFKTHPARAQRNRNLNDFAADVSADALPQWVFVTPNMENDAHDTGVSFGAKWLQYFLGDLLENKNFNSERTLIMITFDENETYAMENRIFTAILGKALPKNLVGTTESLFMTHYSMLSTVQANWGLKSLGRNDVNATLSNVIPFVAEKSGWKGNADVPAAKRPLLNLTGVAPGPLSNKLNTPFYAPPQQHTKGAGGGEALLQPCLDASATADKGPVPTPRVGSNYYGSEANVGSTDTCKKQLGKGPAGGPQPGQGPAGPHPGQGPAGPHPGQGPAGPQGPKGPK